jgi:predicted permease
MKTLLQDLRYGARMLVKNPGFTLVAVITLALGIGVNTAIFSVTDKLLMRSLALKSPDQLVLMTSVSVNPYFVSNAFSYPEFSDYRASSDSFFSGLLAFSTTRFELLSNDRIERVRGEYVSANYFDVIGVSAGSGRTFSPEEDRTPGNQPVAVVSDQFWRRRFGGDQTLIGKTITLNNIPITVIGVAPPTFNGMVLENPTEIWIPVLMHGRLEQSKFIENRSDRFLQLLARVKDNTSLAQAEAGMDLLAQQVKEAHTPPGTITKGLPFSEQHIKFQPGGKGISSLRKRFSSPLKLLMAVVGLVLLIACANVAGLLLARGVDRRKEMAIRLSLGAGRFRMAQQLLTESLLLALTGGVAGLLLAPWLVSLLIKLQSRLDAAKAVLGEGVDWRMLGFTMLATLFAGILFGVVPAWQSSKADLISGLKEEGAFAHGDRRFSLRSFLVVTQIALAIVVLIGAGLCIKSFRNLMAIDPGYETENLLVVPLDLDDKKYDEGRGAAMQKQVFDRLTALPGVTDVSYALVLPLGSGKYMSSIFVEGRQPLPNEQMAFDANIVGPRYHETMGIKLVEGRGFTDQDRTGTQGVVIINEEMERRLFPGEKALGKRLTLKTGGPSLEVIGISHDVKVRDLTENPVPHFDLPALQRGYDGYTNFVVRSRTLASGMTSSARSDLLSLDPSLSVNEIGPLSDEVGKALAGTRLASTLVGVFGLVALLLASVGLYGVMAWIVSRRTREIGIRMALGAQAGDVVSLIIRYGMLLTALGCVAGVGAAWACMKFFERQFYGVSATDPLTFVVIVLLLGLVALLACYIPARRATRVDPLVALRTL